MRGLETKKRPDSVDISGITDAQYWGVVEDFIHSDMIMADFFVDHISVGIYQGIVDDESTFDLRDLVRNFIGLFDEERHPDEPADNTMDLLAAVATLDDCRQLLTVAIKDRVEKHVAKQKAWEAECDRRRSERA